MEPSLQLAGNASVNERIHRCLAKVHPDDVSKFVRRFREQRPQQAAHTYRELLVGAYLADLPVPGRYDLELHGKTPDWSVFDESGSISGIIELMTFHQTAEIDRAIGEHWGRGQVWCDWMPQNAPRLYQKLQEKAERYELLARQLDVPYVVSVFGEFTASVDQHEVEETLFSLHGGAFTQFAWLSGVLYFQESFGTYRFKYFANPSHPRQLPLRDLHL